MKIKCPYHPWNPYYFHCPLYTSYLPYYFSNVQNKPTNTRRTDSKNTRLYCNPNTYQSHYQQNSFLTNKNNKKNNNKYMDLNPFKLCISRVRIYPVFCQRHSQPTRSGRANWIPKGKNLPPPPCCLFIYYFLSLSLSCASHLSHIRLLTTIRGWLRR